MKRVYICRKKKYEQPTNPLYCYVKECDFKFIMEMHMVKKIPKALEFNHLEINNINYVNVFSLNEVGAKKVCC